MNKSALILSFMLALGLGACDESPSFSPPVALDGQLSHFPTHIVASVHEVEKR